MTTAPAFFKRLTTVASYGGWKFSNIWDPHVVRIPFVQKLSFTATGIPSSGCNGFPKDRNTYFTIFNETHPVQVTATPNCYLTAPTHHLISCYLKKSYGTQLLTVDMFSIFSVKQCFRKSKNPGSPTGPPSAGSCITCSSLGWSVYQNVEV